MPNGESTQHVSTKATRKRILQWMIRIEVQDGLLGLMGKCLKEFPQHFQQKNYHANIAKASKWWKGQIEFFRQLEEEGNCLSMVCSSTAIRRRMNVKTLSGHGRKQVPWVLWLHEELKVEFSRLRAAGVKFSVKLLVSLAKEILTSSQNPLFSKHHRDPRSGKSLLDLVNLSWVQAFMVQFNIVGRTQTGKLLVNPIKQAYIKQIVAYHMGELNRGFESGELNEDLIENVDETHFIINMDNGKTLGFRGDDSVKYADVVSGGFGITMVVQVSGGQNGRIHDPFLIFQNQGCTYLIQGCPDNVLGVSYWTATKGFMTGAVWVDYLNESRAIQPDSLERRKLIYVDNCASHNDTTQALLTCSRLNIERKKLPANATDLCQPIDSFIIAKIKDAWSRHWKAYKLQCVQSGHWQNEVHIDGRASRMLKNPGKRFFMELAVAAVKDVNEQQDQRGINFAHKAMIHTGLARNILSRWHIKQLTPELQSIISKYSEHFKGAPVPILV